MMNDFGLNDIGTMRMGRKRCVFRGGAYGKNGRNRIAGFWKSNH